MPRKPPAASAGDYDDYRDRQAEISRDRSKAGREIGPLPEIANPARRELCRRDLELFSRTYFPARFPLPFADVHREAIRRIQACVLDQGGDDNLFALAFMRGGGKTTLAEVAVIYAIAYGHRRFVVLIQATEPLATRSLKKIQRELETNEYLAEDFPEITFPIRALERIHNRAKGQTLDGEPTRIEWTADGVVLPTVAGAPSSAACIHVAGITGAVKGLSMVGSGGQIVRPDLVLLDDCQTRQSAKSPTQTDEREAIITDDVMGLAGPSRAIAAINLCTPIYLNDLAERLLDRERHPEWSGQRTRMLISMPTNMELWDQYGELRRDGKRDGNGTEAASLFYLEHQAAMDAGAVAAWPSRVTAGSVTAMSAVELAMILYYQNPRGFAAEYQCEPAKADLATGSKELDAGAIAARLSGVERYMIPTEATKVVAFIDCGLFLHWYAVVAFNPTFGGSVVDYGCWPGQSRTFFSADDARPKLSGHYPDLSPAQLVFRGLEDLSRHVLGRTYYRQGGGEEVVRLCLVDSGYETKAVYQWVRQSAYVGILYPSKGIGRTMTSRGVSEWQKRPGEEVGYHWRKTKGEEARTRAIQFDPDAWKSFLYGALTTPPGGQTGLALYGREAGRHEMIGHHLAAEYASPVTIRGTTFDKWIQKPDRPDNHLLDCLVGACVAASVSGLVWTATGQPEPPKPAAPPLSFASARRAPQAPTGGGPKPLTYAEMKQKGGVR